MFDRFTEEARRAILLAHDEARILNHGYIGTEHLLLGLLREDEGVAATALAAVDVSLDGARQRVRLALGTGEQEPAGHLPFSPPAKKSLEYAFREAKKLDSEHIGTEHLLLGLLREAGGGAAQVLVNLGVDLGRARRQVLELIRPGQ